MLTINEFQFDEDPDELASQFQSCRRKRLRECREKPID